ncbi:MAG: hypothetical protein BWY73_01250 [candidate division TA06 bacterium ADurb.Bin417]|uniref:Uncharacterized protein n=1 Tax=candidate division TA06 bacterium ADurb.Bin417 TaxID=1852828 RepID=A0A1V5MCB6_UNCT6|nr:MAG: hypothetical protein BWY73_01250 [candidate division TA06 bacterium ADurb.Bin417]
MFLKIIDDRRLQAAETEIERVAHAGFGKSDRFPGLERQALQRRAARIGKVQHPGYLVEDLAGGVVAGLAQKAEIIRSVDQEEGGVASGDDQAQGREVRQSLRK